MARIRSVKPDLRRDENVATWPRDVRYTWVLLFGYLDDRGRGRDDIRLLLSDLYPLDRDVTEKKLNAWLDLMTQPSVYSEIPSLCRYEVGGVRYLHAPKWALHQRIDNITESKLPPCSDPDHKIDAPPRKPRQDVLTFKNGSGGHS